MGRQPGESRALGDRYSFVGLIALFLAMALPLVLTTGAGVFNAMRRSKTAQVRVSVARGKWKTLYSPREDWESQGFSDPLNPTLWNSPTNRDQIQHEQRVARIPGGTLWLGARFNEQELARAYFTHSNVLYLGYVSGRYRVFVDGELILEGNSISQSHPIAVPVSLRHLVEERPLSVALEIINDSGESVPDELGGARGEGFVSAETEDAFALSELWKRHSEPILFSSALFLVGCVFFLGWLSDRKKQEYGFFAAYAVHQALTEVLRLDFVRSLTSARNWDRASISLLIWEGSLGLLLGMSFARAKRSWILPIGLVTAAVSLLPYLVGAGSSMGALASAQNELLLWYVPLAYFRGAVACLIHWHVLSRNRVIGLFKHRFTRQDSVDIQGIALSTQSRQEHQGRKDALLRVGVGLGLVGALYFSEALSFANADPSLSHFRLLNFTVLLALYGLTIVEIRDRRANQQVAADDSQAAASLSKAA